MGRELKRVPVDFDWPMHTVWKGFLMPDRLHETPCPDCDSRGTTTARQWVEQIAYLLLMLDDDLNDQARGRQMHPYFRDTGSRAWNVRPSADIAEFGTGLAGREGSFLGHDSIDSWRATEKVIAAAGLDPDTWGYCRTCKGHGSTETYPGQRAEAEAWEMTEPPTGDGWQIWETVSEGSPITPVFATAEALAEHYAAEKDGSAASVLEWLHGPGWSPSGIISSAGVQTSEDLILATNHQVGS